MIKELMWGFVAMLAPLRCPGCDETLPLDAVPAHRLQGSAAEVIAGCFCGACAPLIDALGAGPALFAYGGPLAVAVQGLKYERRFDFQDALCALMRTGALRHAGHVDAVVAVPQHSKRTRERGFVPAELLAASVAQTLGVPLLRERLRRIRDSPRQASLPEAQREDNVRGAFVGKKDAEHRRLLLIDDVRTTGATLKSATGALYRSGASTVRLMTLAAVQ